MKKSFVAMAGIAAMVSSASAADLGVRPYTSAPPPAVAAIYNWNGLYIGVNGGGGSSHKCWELIGADGDVVFPSVDEGCHNATGGTAGGQIGYRWQSTNWVFGIEGQGNWADFSGSNSSLAFDDETNQSKIHAFGLITGQLGYAWNNWLVYVKGGAAIVDDKYETFSTSTGVSILSASETRVGPTIGAGLEFGFAPNWSIGLEYDHVFLGHEHGLTLTGDFTDTVKIGQDIDMGLARLNYRFGAWGPVIR
jgi:outer membrane immunogenic protein